MLITVPLGGGEMEFLLITKVPSMVVVEQEDLVELVVRDIQVLQVIMHILFVHVLFVVENLVQILLHVLVVQLLETDVLKVD